MKRDNFYIQYIFVAKRLKQAFLFCYIKRLKEKEVLYHEKGFKRFILYYYTKTKEIKGKRNIYGIKKNNYEV